jgi:hypothetical protein
MCGRRCRFPTVGPLRTGMCRAGRRLPGRPERTTVGCFPEPRRHPGLPPAAFPRKRPARPVRGGCGVRLVIARSAVRVVDRAEVRRSRAPRRYRPLPALSRFARGRTRPRKPKPSIAARDRPLTFHLSAARNLPLQEKRPDPSSRMPVRACARSNPCLVHTTDLLRRVRRRPRPLVPSPNSPASLGTAGLPRATSPRTRPPGCPRAARAGRAGQTQHCEGKGGGVISEGRHLVQSRIAHPPFGRCRFGLHALPPATTLHFLRAAGLRGDEPLSVVAVGVRRGLPAGSEPSRSWQITPMACHKRSSLVIWRQKVLCRLRPRPWQDTRKATRRNPGGGPRPIRNL